MAVFPIPHAFPHRAFQCTTCALTQLCAPNPNVVYWRIIQKKYSCCKIYTVQWEWINKYLILSYLFLGHFRVSPMPLPCIVLEFLEVGGKCKRLLQAEKIYWKYPILYFLFCNIWEGIWRFLGNVDRRQKTIRGGLNCTIFFDKKNFFCCRFMNYTLSSVFSYTVLMA